jgi:NADH-quinone oxidoreductase subunit A
VEAFLPILILLVLAMIVAAGIFVLTSVLGPKNPLAVKLSVYECGVKPEGNARTPFKIHFYLIAVLFLLFDVEAAFFLPWALVYRESLLSGGTLLLALVVYLGLMVLGLWYVFRKDCLRLG